MTTPVRAKFVLRRAQVVPMLQTMNANHDDSQPQSDASHAAHRERARSSTLGILFGFSLLSLPFLGAGSWLYRLSMHGMVASSMSEILTDYVVIAVLYVSFWSAITVRSIGKQLDPLTPKAGLILGTVAAYAVPVAAFCVANIIIELGDDDASDSAVARIAGLVAILGPVALFSGVRALARLLQGRG